jgi:pescadillo protein
LEQEHYDEIKAEAAGIPFSEYNAKKETNDSKKKVVTFAEIEAKEAKELSKIMMSKRDKKLYEKIQYGKARKQEATKKLLEKRKKSKSL